MRPCEKILSFRRSLRSRLGAHISHRIREELGAKAPAPSRERSERRMKMSLRDSFSAQLLSRLGKHICWAKQLVTFLSRESGRADGWEFSTGSYCHGSERCVRRK